MMDKEKLLEWLRVRIELKNKQIEQLEAEGCDTTTALFEWGAYKKVMDEIEKGTFE